MNCDWLTNECSLSYYANRFPLRSPEGKTTSSFSHTTTAVWQMSTAQHSLSLLVRCCQCSAVQCSGAVAEISTSTIDIRYNNRQSYTWNDCGFWLPCSVFILFNCYISYLDAKTCLYVLCLQYSHHVVKLFRSFITLNSETTSPLCIAICN